MKSNNSTYPVSGYFKFDIHRRFPKLCLRVKCIIRAWFWWRIDVWVYAKYQMIEMTVRRLGYRQTSGLLWSEFTKRERIEHFRRYEIVNQVSEQDTVSETSVYSASIQRMRNCYEKPFTSVYVNSLPLRCHVLISSHTAIPLSRHPHIFLKWAHR